MERFCVSHDCHRLGCDVEMVQSNVGEWVGYDDASAEIAKLRAEADLESRRLPDFFREVFRAEFPGDSDARAVAIHLMDRLRQDRRDAEAENIRLRSALSAARAALDGERSTADTFREAIRLLLANCDDDHDEAAHTPPRIRQAIMDYDQRRAAEAQPTPVRCPECDGTGRRVKYHGGSINDPNLIGLAMESLPCRCQAAEARP